MRNHPRTQLVGWAGLLIGALLILSSCGDDSSSVSFDPEVPGQDPLDPAPEADTDPGPNADDDEVPGGVDRSGELIGRFEIVNYSLADGGGLTNIVGSVEPFVEFTADGTLTFQTGCNGGTASWSATGTYYDSNLGFLDDTPEGQSLTINEVSKENATCDGFLGEQDIDLVDNLLATLRFRITDEGGVNLLDEFLLVATEAAS